MTNLQDTPSVRYNVDQDRFHTMETSPVNVTRHDITSLVYKPEHVGKKNGHHRKTGAVVKLDWLMRDEPDLERHVYRAPIDPVSVNNRMYIRMDRKIWFLDLEATGMVVAALLAGENNVTTHGDKREYRWL